MTHNTDSERAEFIQWANAKFYDGIADISDTWDESSGRFLDSAHQMAWCLFRDMKARRAPASPVSMPEPFIRHMKNGVEYSCYTENQVRALLASINHCPKT